MILMVQCTGAIQVLNLTYLDNRQTNVCLTFVFTDICLSVLMKFIDSLTYACVLQSKRIKIQCLRFIDDSNALFFGYMRLIGPDLLGSILAIRSINRLTVNKPKMSTHVFF